MKKREKSKYPGIYRVGKKYYIRYRISGKGHEEVVEGKLEDALREKKDREHRGKHGKYEILARQEKTTFDELLALYRKQPDAREYITSQEETYLDAFRGMRLSQFSRKDLFDFRDKVKATPKQCGGGGVTDSHVNRVLAGLRRLFHFAIARELMEKSVNPFPETPKSGLFYPEKKGLRNFFTEAQMIQIVGNSPDWLRPMVQVSYYTGMRIGEVLKLRWNHVDLESGIIHLPNSKTLKDDSGAGQRIVMQKELVSIFKSLPQGSGWVFVREDGLPYRHWTLFKAFRNVLKSLGIDTEKYSWKELRHTTGTLLHLKGADPLAIKDQLRHTTIQTTENFYISTDIEYQRSQVERLTLNQKAEA